jgi:hypothetical protein
MEKEIELLKKSTSNVEKMELKREEEFKVLAANLQNNLEKPALMMS